MQAVERAIEFARFFDIHHVVCVFDYHFLGTGYFAADQVCALDDFGIIAVPHHHQCRHLKIGQLRKWDIKRADEGRAEDSNRLRFYGIRTAKALEKKTRIPGPGGLRKAGKTDGVNKQGKSVRIEIIWLLR